MGNDPIYDPIEEPSGPLLTLTREDVILLSLSGLDGEPTNGILAMGAIFLVSYNHDDLRSLFSFGPSQWGPWDTSVSEEMNDLIRGGLMIDYYLKADGSLHEMRLTAKGQRRADYILNHVGRDLTSFVGDVANWMRANTLSQAISGLQHLYPNFFKP